jgi:hypothetical protein
MKTKVLLLSLAVWFAAGAACFADDFMGTWKLDPAKSKIPRGAPRNSLVRYEWEFFFETRVTVDGFDGHGRKAHSEWSGRFDGKDRPVTGGTDEDTRAYSQVNDRTLRYTSKKSGKVVLNGQVVIAPDGKTRTVTSWARQGRKTIRSLAVYHKV